MPKRVPGKPKAIARLKQNQPTAPEMDRALITAPTRFKSLDAYKDLQRWQKESRQADRLWLKYWGQQRNLNRHSKSIITRHLAISEWRITQQKEEEEEMATSAQHRTNILLSAGQNDDFVENAMWAMRVFPLVRKRIKTSQGSSPSIAKAKPGDDLFTIQWRILDQAAGHLRNAPSLIGVGFLEDVLTTKNGWESLLDRIERAGGYPAKPNKQSDDSYRRTSEMLDQFTQD